jgi:hypothetical protein
VQPPDVIVAYYFNLECLLNSKIFIRKLFYIVFLYYICTLFNVDIMKDDYSDPEPFTKEEEEYLEYLISKYGKKLGTKDDKYRVYN